jgi:hypothetical protein
VRDDRVIPPPQAGVVASANARTSEEAAGPGSSVGPNPQRAQQSDESAVALTVEDEDGDRYLVIRVVRREADRWRRAGGSEGLVRSITGVHDPYLPLYAHANGRFFGGGSLHTTVPDVVHVRLVWEDGQRIEAEVENGVVLLFGTRDSLDPATLEFLDSSGSVVGRHPAFVDER